MRVHLKILAASIAVFAQVAVAEEVSYDFVACTHNKRNVLEQGADFSSFGAESWGSVASSKTKEWESASTRCVGYVRVMAGAPYGKGNCKWFTAAGDTAVGEFEFDKTTSKFTWLSGTGKLKGIQGSGSFQYLSEAKPAEEGTSQSCRRDWGTYKLPG